MEGTNFPRGKLPPSVATVRGQTNKGNLESTVATKDKLQDLFINSEKRGKEGKPKSKKRQHELSADELKFIAGKKGKAANQSSFEVVPLSYEMLTPDLLSLGVVVEIYNDSMLIVLPGRATGKVMATEVSSSYTNRLLEDQSKLKDGKHVNIQTLDDIFTIGQVVIVKVNSVETNYKGHHDVKLTTNPKYIHEGYNSSMVSTGLTLVGAVKSQEDKGFQIDLGISNVVAFLPNDQVPDKHTALRIGQLVYCKVLHVDSSKGARCTVRVSLKNDGGKLKSTFAAGGHVNYSAILPGMVMHSLVEESNETGLKVNLGGLEGLIHSDHIAPDKPVTIASEWPATVLYLHPNLTTPYCTLRTRDLVPVRSVMKVDLSMLGTMQTARITKVTNRGLIVQLAEGNHRGLISINHLGDGQCVTKEELTEKFKPNSMIQCRILKIASFENMYICSLNKELLKASVVDINQVYPGMNLKCKVTGANKGGLEVTFGRKLRGFVPNVFLGRKTFLKKGAETFTGKLFDGKVMAVDVQTKRVVITFAQKIIKSTGAVISSLDGAMVGDSGHAIVRKVSGGGVVVTTIGGVKGFVPVCELADTQYLNCEAGSIINYIVQKVEYDRDQLLVQPYDEKSKQHEMESTHEKKAALKKRRDDKHANVNDIEDIGEPKKKKRRKNKTRKTKGSLTNSDENDECDHQSDKSENPTGDQIAMEDVPYQTSEDSTFQTVGQFDLSNTENANIEKKLHGMLTENDFNALFGSSSAFWSDQNPEADQPITINCKNNALKLNEEKTKKSEHTRPQRKISTEESVVLTDSIAKKLIINFEKQGDSPNGAQEAKESWYWINLILHYTSLGDIDKARKVGQQGLSYGPIIENSTHGLRIRMTLLALELQHGTTTACEEVLKNALDSTDNKYDCYKKAAITYSKQGHFQKAQDVYQIIIKKYGGNVDGWINFAKFYFENGRTEDARNVFHTAAKNATNFNLKDTSLTSRFATLEIEFGDASRGAQLFDTLLQNEPGRTDIWMVYLQALIKNNHNDSARTAFQKAFEYNWKPQKVRSLLALYKTFEEKNGNDETKMHFRDIALKVLGAAELSVLDK